MRTITFLNPNKLVFGPQAYATFREDVKLHGFKRLFIVSIGPMDVTLKVLHKEFSGAGINCAFDYSIVNEPTFSEFEAILAKAKTFETDCVIGVGGGSVMDVAKLLAAQLTNSQTLNEVVGIGNLTERSTYLICIPTTSGTGSEVSPNALFVDHDDNKVGIVSPYLVPDAAYICPEFTVSVPASVTAATGIDALTHCLEAYANNFAHPMADVIAIEGVRLIAENIVAACKDGSDIEARTNMALGSVYGGMCLGPVNTGAVHALAYPLGAIFHVPHGLSNALLLPYVMEFNLPSAIKQYAAIGKAVGAVEGATDEETAKNGIAKIREIIAVCEIPARLSDVGIPEDAIDRMAAGAIKIQRLLKNNLREVSFEDARAIYRAAY
ncbi:Alcohol dehydrogenase [hydrothermal vent metagenome]|uniref:Alcohol dehydrogenase n=1 Tax=hydrothermal vent metagenome TaxID=652676 RepID=A0A3B0RJE6_9ZZZZ